MQVVDHALGIGVLGVEDVLALAVPPEPVLHNVVDGDAQLAVFVRDAEQFVLRLVAVLALPEAVGPLAEHGGRASELAIAGDDAVEAGAVEEVVVDGVGDFGADVEGVLETVVEAAARGVVPEQAVAHAGEHERHGDAGVVLREVDGLAAIIPHAGLVLSQSVDGFAGAVTGKRHVVFGAVGLLAVHRSGVHGLRLVVQQNVAVGVGVGDAAGGAIDGDFELRGGQRDLVAAGLYAEIRCGPHCLDDRRIVIRWKRCRWRVHKMNDGVAADLQLQRANLHVEQRRRRPVAQSC